MSSIKPALLPQDLTHPFRPKTSSPKRFKNRPKTRVCNTLANPILAVDRRDAGFISNPWPYKTHVSLQEKEFLEKEVLEKDLEVYLKVIFREEIM